MKKYILFCIVCLLVSCDTYFNVQPTLIRIEDFRKAGVLYTEEEAQKLLLSGRLGKSRQNAGVGMVFDDTGKMLTPDEYNCLFGPDAISVSKNFIYKFTDLSTFRAVTGRKEAVADYTKIRPLSNNKGVYLFDPLQSNYLTFLEEDKLINTILNSLPRRGKIKNVLSRKKLISDVINSLSIKDRKRTAIISAERDFYTTDEGDFFINPIHGVGYLKDIEGNLVDPNADEASKLGHAAGSLGSSGVYPTFAELAKHVITAEAQGYSCETPTPFVPCDKNYIPTLNDEVAYVPMTKYWIDGSSTASKNGVEMWTNVSYSEASRMARFWYLSCFGPTIYDLLARKDINPTNDFITGDGVYEKTYCSLFLWQAIYNKTNKRINVDNDGGRWCFPNDILRDGSNRAHFVLIWRLI